MRGEALAKTMPPMKILLAILLSGAAILCLLPPRADAACGASPARALYETPDLRAYPRGAGLRACVWATGKDRRIGSYYDDGGTYEVDSVSGTFGGRYVWTSFRGL